MPRYWLTLEEFVEVATECGVCRFAVSLTRVLNKFNKNPFVSKMQHPFVSKTQENIKNLLAYNLLGNSMRFNWQDITSEPPQQRSHDTEIKKHGFVFVSRLQGAVRRIRAEFWYLTRMRRVLQIRVCLKMQ